MTERQTIILFIKAPGSGKVKSRLAKTLGEVLARRAQAHFTLDILKTVRTYPMRIFFYPRGSGETIGNWLGKDLCRIPQKGRDLGQRMKNAFDQSFSEGIERALLIGSDIPDLPSTVVNQAFEALEKNDAVIGPAADGGYYLIGFKENSFVPMIFRGIKWSSGSVFRSTMEIFGKMGTRVHILPIWRDVDTIEDLRALVTRNRRTHFRRSETMNWAMRNWEKIFGQ